MMVDNSTRHLAQRQASEPPKRQITFSIKNQLNSVLQLVRASAGPKATIKDAPQRVDAHTRSTNFSASVPEGNALRGMFEFRFAHQVELLSLRLSFDARGETEKGSFVASTSPPDQVRCEIRHRVDRSNSRHVEFSISPAKSMLADADWMSAQASQLRHRTLRQIVIPGAHDAATSAIDVDSGFTADSPWYWRAFPRVAAGWARAQGDRIHHQLLGGVRYLDIRVGRKPDGTIWTRHGMWSSPFEDVLSQIEKFCMRHSSEFLILDFQHLHNLSSQDRLDLAREVTTRLDRHLYPSTTGLGVTLGDLWETDQRVLVLWGDEKIAVANADVWPRNRWLFSPWANTPNASELRTRLDRFIDGASDQRLFVLQGVLTPDRDMVASGVVGRGAQSLREVAGQVNPNLLGWIRNDWASRGLNIVMVDFVESSGLIRLARELNASD